MGSIEVPVHRFMVREPGLSCADLIQPSGNPLGDAAAV